MSLELTISGVDRANKVRDFILKTSNSELKSKLKCRKCKGTGLGNTSWNSEGDMIYWDTSSYCEYCKGVGYINPLEFDNTLYKCSICDGEGMIQEKPQRYGQSECRNCNGFGYVNWIENLFGKTE